MSDPTPILSTATLALEYLYQQIVDGTAERLPAASPSVVFGWREPVKKDNQGPGGANRVVVQPGDAGGKVGDLEGAKLPGRNPPPIATMIEVATIWMWAQDPNDSSELGQWRAARRLHDVVVPIIIRTFRGRWKQLSKVWVRPELERRFGAEMQMVIALEAMIPDDVVPQAPGGTATPEITIANQSASGVPVPC